MVLCMIVSLLALKLQQKLPRAAAILDLSITADIEGAQLGSLEKLVADDHIYPWSKNGTCGTI